MAISWALPGIRSEGWVFSRDQFGNEVEGGFPLHRLCTAHDPHLTGQVIVPTLWDEKTSRVVNNESAEIVRMLNSAFDHVTGDRQDFYPETLRAEIDRWNEAIYPALNNGVYRAGFAKTQAAYDEAVAGRDEPGGGHGVVRPDQARALRTGRQARHRRHRAGTGPG